MVRSSGIVQPVGCEYSIATRNCPVAHQEGMMDAVEREVTVPAPPEAVWPELAGSEGISAWFGAQAQVDVRPGGRGVFRWPDGVERGVVVEDVEPARRLAFRWLPFA